MIHWLTILLLTIVPYTKTLVQVPVACGDTVSGYLLLPSNGNGHLAILALHDHGAYFTIGKEKLTSPSDTAKVAEAARWVNKFYDGAFVADTLASRGYVVLVIDALYWGERSLSPTLPGGRELDSLKRLNKRLRNEQPEFYQQYWAKTGTPWFERILADDKACVDYLRSLPYVDTTRIGVWGFSMGAYRAWQLASEDPRVAFCAAASWLQAVPETNSDAGQSWQLKNVSSWSMYRPTKDSVSYGEIVSRIAPRPMLLQYGAQDKLFPYGDHDIRPWPALQVQVLDGEHRFTRTHLQNLLQFVQEIYEHK